MHFWTSLSLSGPLNRRTSSSSSSGSGSGSGGGGSGSGSGSGSSSSSSSNFITVSEPSSLGDIPY